MDAMKLWDACKAAYSCCPQARPLDCDSREFGWEKTYGELRMGTMEEVATYWGTETVGGRILWHLGYVSSLSEDAVLWILNRRAR